MSWIKKAVAAAGMVSLGFAILSLAACAVLVASEASRPPPADLAIPKLTPLDVPFVHRWASDKAHPLLAAAAIDINNDGRDEVFLGGSDGQPDALLSWREGKLVDIAATTGIGDTSATYGALSLDFNSDGRVDLLTVGHAGLVLWLNQGERFERKQLNVPLTADAVPMAVSAGDIDRDGQVDLYLSMFVAPGLFRSPVFNDPSHAKRNLLLRGVGNLQFLDITDQVTGGLQNTFTASLVDLDGDGWLDLALAQNTGEAEILRNRGNGSFERVQLRTGYGFWMGLAFADLHGSGQPDIFFSNAGNSIPGFLVKGDRREEQPAELNWLLLRNDGGMKFSDITAVAGLTGFGFAWGGVFEDMNLDGKLDLLVAENYVKWPVHRLFKLPGKLLLGATNSSGAPPRFFTSDAGANPSYGHVPLIADLDGDGRNDLVWANMDGPARAFLNRSEGRFLSVRLPDTAASIGARVFVEGPLQTAPDSVQQRSTKATPRSPQAIRFVVAGEGLTSDRTTQHQFGFAKDAPDPAALVVLWADGRKTRIEAPALMKPLVLAAPPD